MKKITFITVASIIILIGLCVSNINAEPIPDASLAITASSYSLPDLQFDDSQEKVMIYGDISPEKVTQTKLISSPQESVKKQIPESSIIYHSDNTTRVFDQDGNQILITDDSTAEIVHTHKGDIPASFIHEVPDDSVIIDAGDRLFIIHNNKRIFTIIAQKSDNFSTKSNTELINSSSWPSSCLGQPYSPQYIEGAEAAISSSSVKEFSSDWTVPEKPVNNAYSVTIWDGLYRCDPGDPHTGLVQPVLEWNWQGQGLRWTMTTWYVWTNSSIAPNNDAIISERKRTVYDGDKMRGIIKINTEGYDAIGQIIDLGPNGGGSSTLYLASTTAPTRMPYQNLYAQVVFEGTDAMSQHDASYLTGHSIFNNFVLTDHDDNNLIPTINMISFKNIPYWDQYNFTDSNNLTAYNRWPMDITLVNNQKRTNPPVTDFSTAIPGGIGHTTVPFRDGSTGSPFLWYWDFGDGGNSIEQNPTHSYLLPGSFTVNLTTWNAGGPNSRVKQNYIIVISPVPIPFFIVNTNSGTAPLTAQFTDKSTGDVQEWNWSFGDGDTTNSTLKDPVHTYEENGTYSVSLAVKNSSGYWNSTTMPNYITVTAPPRPIPSFTASPTSGSAPLTVRFTDTSTGSPTSGIWDFGDGNTTNATMQNPVHTYWSRGSFNVSLTAINAGGSNMTTKVRYIKVTNATDIGVFRSGQWILDYNIDGTVDRRVNYGALNDTQVVGDFNNDGQTDIGVFRSGQWILDYYIDGTVNRQFPYGLSTDVPYVGDFNNDGQTDIGVFRSGQWILDYNIDGTVDRRVNYGAPNDTPVVSDFNNDGITDIGVFRSISGSGWWIFDYGMDGTEDRRFQYGGGTDFPVAGDFNNDGIMDIGVFRSGQWILDYGIDGTVNRRFNYGLATDKAVVGDFNNWR